jgi:guanylate kinase
MNSSASKVASQSNGDPKKDSNRPSDRSESDEFLAPSQIPQFRLVNHRLYDLFVLTGPYGAGKTTIEENYTDNHPQQISRAFREVTRELSAGEVGHMHQIDEDEFKKNKNEGKYIVQYSIPFFDPSGKPGKVFYGAPGDRLFETLERRAAVMTIGNYDAFNDFCNSDAYEKLSSEANIIPVIVNTNSVADLKKRIKARNPCVKQLEERLATVNTHHKLFKALSKTLPHLIINDNVPLSAVSNERGKDTKELAKRVGIDDALRKFGAIVDYYSYLKDEKVVVGEDFDIHKGYLDFIVKAHFPMRSMENLYTALDKEEVVFERTHRVSERVKRATGSVMLPDHVFSTLSAITTQPSEEYKGAVEIVLSEEFSKIVKGQSQAQQIFDMILPGHGQWIYDEEGVVTGKLYSLTDIKPDKYDDEKPYSLYMRLEP